MGSRSLFTAPMHVSLETAGHTASLPQLSHNAVSFSAAAADLGTECFLFPSPCLVEGHWLQSCCVT